MDNIRSIPEMALALILKKALLKMKQFGGRVYIARPHVSLAQETPALFLSFGEGEREAYTGDSRFPSSYGETTHITIDVILADVWGGKASEDALINLSLLSKEVLDRVSLIPDELQKYDDIDLQGYGLGGDFESYVLSHGKNNCGEYRLIGHHDSVKVSFVYDPRGDPRGEEFLGAMLKLGAG